MQENFELELREELDMANGKIREVGADVIYLFIISFNPFTSIGRTSTSNAKVKVVVICLNIPFMT